MTIERVYCQSKRIISQGAGWAGQGSSIFASPNRVKIGTAKGRTEIRLRMINFLPTLSPGLRGFYNFIQSIWCILLLLRQRLIIFMVFPLFGLLLLRRLNATRSFPTHLDTLNSMGATRWSKISKMMLPQHRETKKNKSVPLGVETIQTC